MQIGYVKGLDLSPGEIEEAQRRFADTSRRRPGTAFPSSARHHVDRREESFWAILDQIGPEKIVYIHVSGLAPELVSPCSVESSRLDPRGYED